MLYNFVALCLILPLDMFLIKSHVCEDRDENKWLKLRVVKDKIPTMTELSFDFFITPVAIEIIYKSPKKAMPHWKIWLFYRVCMLDIHLENM